VFKKAYMPAVISDAAFSYSEVKVFIPST